MQVNMRRQRPDYACRMSSSAIDADTALDGEQVMNRVVDSADRRLT